MPGNWKKKTFVQTIFQILTWKVLLIVKNMFTMKNLTDFRKTMETGVDRAWTACWLSRGYRPAVCHRYSFTHLDELRQSGVKFLVLGDACTPEF